MEGLFAGDRFQTAPPGFDIDLADIIGVKAEAHGFDASIIHPLQEARAVAERLKRNPVGPDFPCLNRERLAFKRCDLPGQPRALATVRPVSFPVVERYVAKTAVPRLVGDIANVAGKQDAKFRKRKAGLFFWRTIAPLGDVGSCCSGQPMNKGILCLEGSFYMPAPVRSVDRPLNVLDPVFGQTEVEGL